MLILIFSLCVSLAVISHIYAVKKARADMKPFYIVSDCNAAVKLGISFKC
jgi:hypothetical protein